MFISIVYLIQWEVKKMEDKFEHLNQLIGNLKERGIIIIVK